MYGPVKGLTQAAKYLGLVEPCRGFSEVSDGTGYDPVYWFSETTLYLTVLLPVLLLFPSK